MGLNRGPLLRDAASLPALEPRRVEELVEGGATILDGQKPREFDAEHIPRSLNVTMSKGAVGTRAVWVVDPECDVVVLAASDEDAERDGVDRLLHVADGGVADLSEHGVELVKGD